MSTLSNPLLGVNAENPLGFPGQTGTNVQAPSAGGATTPANNTPNPITTTTPAPSGIGGGQLTNTLAQQNVATGAYRNQLIPQFAQLFGQNAGAAQQYFTSLLNLGSPYYQQQQRASFDQG